jgi:hypothetical protein
MLGEFACLDTGNLEKVGDIQTRWTDQGKTYRILRKEFIATENVSVRKSYSSPCDYGSLVKNVFCYPTSSIFLVSKERYD